jgi:mRNA-degrading endonuclease RelE of RelBE toxin-antitoxin system
MKSSTTASFRKRLRQLPPEVRKLAYKNFKLWAEDPQHPSLHFKKVGRFWSARIGLDYRALAVVEGEESKWFWIGSHDEYERLIAE